MNLIEFAELIDANLEVILHSGQNGRWTAKFQAAEVKEGAVLASTYGDGQSPQEAMDVYARDISGQKLVFYAMSPELRKTYIVPQLEIQK